MSARALLVGRSHAVAVIGAVALVAACRALPDPDAVAQPTWVTVNGAQLAYVDQGKGEVVVLLHSVATDLRVWEDVRRRFPNDYRVVAYSRRHHAPNPWPDDGDSHTLDQHVKDLAALVPALGVGKVHLVGLGLGARVAAHTTIRHPGIVHTLTVGDGALSAPTTEPGLRDLDAFAASFATVHDRIRERDEAGTAAAVVDWLVPERGGWQALPASRRAPYLANARTLFLVVEDPTLRAPGCEALGGVAVAVLVLAGEHTPAGLRSTNAEAAKCAKHSEHVEIGGSGHLWYADNPDEGVRRLVQFLRKHRDR